MAFVWTDRAGREVILDTPEAIDAERTAIIAEIGKLTADAASPDKTVNRAARAHIGNLCDRLGVLEQDIQRWNAHAEERMRPEALRLADWIEEFNRFAWPMLIIGNLLDESLAELHGADNKELRSLPMTDAQRAAIAHSSLSTKPAADATRGEVDDWLRDDPELFRPVSDEGGWFEWLDAEGSTHRLASPLRIEYELGEISSELWWLLPDLRAPSALTDCVEAIEKANSVIPRIFVLQGDLERFRNEARANEEWALFEKTWSQE